ncbi:DnaJ domain-containing protein [Toxoplasma gondii VEG]|uniref:DnaJ domain-containing protein n=1 Tax=Toxoplasma gondii (strain ATCC 50861 / VEG) TaxID=432359 RepID=V4ZGA6_TOXGV|nr:DnaJ domain-containing protein [Toxoplasma gondii VEG]
MPVFRKESVVGPPASVGPSACYAKPRVSSGAVPSAFSASGSSPPCTSSTSAFSASSLRGTDRERGVSGEFENAQPVFKVKRAWCCCSPASVKHTRREEQPRRPEQERETTATNMSDDTAKREDAGNAESRRGSRSFERLFTKGTGPPARPASSDMISWALVPVRPGDAAAGATPADADSLHSPEGTIMGGLFSTRKPKDAGAGISSALKSVGKGVAAGAASLFVLPAVGASQQGVGGFFKGVGAGVVAAVALPVTGVCVAGYQVARGFVNTPEAIHERSQGKKWDKKAREWKENWYSLKEEAEEVVGKENPFKAATAAAAAPKTSEVPGEKREVVDRELYDVLEISTDATQDEIRRQYYRLARKYHPDKNREDPEAKVKFQKVGEAYQVLGDEERRAQYDKFGSAAAQDMPLIDSSLFFMMLFGSEELEPYIGKLKMAMFVEMVDKDAKQAENVSEEMFAFEQRKREVQLALSLCDRIEPFVEAIAKNENAEGAAMSNEVAEWKSKMRLEAEKLCRSSFGDAIVEAIGWTYENSATQFLGKVDTFLGLGGRYAKIQAHSRSVGNSWRTANAAVRAALAARQMQQKAVKKQRSKEKAKKKKMREAAQAASKKGEDPTAAAADAAQDEEEATDDAPSAEDVKQFEETLPLILETMLQICLMDIETTVRAAAKKTFKDMGVDLDCRRRRAEALVELGRIFQQAAADHKKEHKDEKVDALRTMEDAFIKAAQKADEERVRKEGACPNTGQAHGPAAGTESGAEACF